VISETSPSSLTQSPIPAMHTQVFAGILKNGLSVFVVPRPDLPVVSFRIGIRAGSSEDPSGKGGTASLAASLLGRGTKDHDALSLFQIIDASGGSLEASAGRDLTIVSGDSLSTETPTLLGLASEMVRTPSFPEAEFLNKKASFSASLIDSESHPGPMGSNLFYHLIFGSGPYGHPASGTSLSVKRIVREDLVRFVQDNYRPDRSALVLVGDITPEKGFRMAEQYLGNWHSSFPLGAPRDRSSSKPDKILAGTYLIDKPELVQSTVFYGTKGIARNDPSFYNALVFNMILGGTNTSTLNHVIRQKMGLVYYIHTGLDAERHAGPFIVNFQTHAPNTRKVLVAMHRILDESISTLPSQKKVYSIKSELVGVFPFMMNTTPKLASLLLVIWNYNLGMTYFTDYPANVLAVTPPTVLSAGRSLLKDKSFVTVIVGPAKTLKKAGVDAQLSPGS
jgi:zinc protease